MLSSHKRGLGKGMTKGERLARKSGWRPALEGREEFVRENAVSLIAERDRRIVAQRRQLQRLQSTSDSAKWAAHEMRDLVAALVDALEGVSLPPGVRALVEQLRARPGIGGRRLGDGRKVRAVASTASRGTDG